MVSTILRHHGFPADDAIRSPHEGVANEVWLCGPVVVRIAKDPEYVEDFFTESVAAPAVFDAGILTPKPLVYDGSKAVVPVEYSIFERAPGVRLADVDELEDPAAFFRAYGAEIRKLHDRVKSVVDPNGWLDAAWIISPEDLHREYPRADFESVLHGLDGPAPEPATFVHQDLHAENVLVHGGQLSALLDWGDAGWGDPAVDLRFVPVRWMNAALEGYGPVPNRDLTRRLALHVLDHVLDCQDDGKDYGPFGSSTWPEVIEFARRAGR